MTAGSDPVRKVSIVGGGVIGAGWAARFLLHGWQVCVYDPQVGAEQRIGQVLDNARQSLPALFDVQMPAEGALCFADTLAEAVTDADWIQESIPEVLTLKNKVLAEIQQHAPVTAIIGSSTSGFKPGELQQGASNPSQIIVAHPFNPVYLLPVVELVPGPATRKDLIESAEEILLSIGMKPLLVSKEIDAHVADRLLESVWREALWLIKDDIATTEQIDDVIRYGFGLRWAQMGLFETYRLAGGEAGMAHFIEQFGPTLQWPWSRLMDVPELSDDLVQKIARQSDEQSGAYSIIELERIRDDNLVGILRSLKDRKWGAGALLHEHDLRLANRTANEVNLPEESPAKANGPLRLLDLSVLPGWINYNGHMPEFRYVQIFSDSCEKFLSMVGMDAAYVASGRSWYTVESHVRYVEEVTLNQKIYSSLQIMMASARKLHLFYRLHAKEDDRLLACSENMYLHVDRDSGRVSEASEAIQQKMAEYASAHEGLKRPDAVGRTIAQNK